MHEYPTQSGRTWLFYVAYFVFSDNLTLTDGTWSSEELLDHWSFVRTPGSSLLQQAFPLQDTGLRNYSLRYLRKDQNSLTMKAAWLVRSQFRSYPVWSVVL